MTTAAARAGGATTVAGDVEDGKLAVAHLEVARDVLHGILERELAGAQEAAAAVRIAHGIAAFGLDVHVAEVDAGGVGHAHRRRERLAIARRRDTHGSWRW